MSLTRHGIYNTINGSLQSCEVSKLPQFTGKYGVTSLKEKLVTRYQPSPFFDRPISPENFLFKQL